jgi:uncharacterized lipoprotein YbaY
MRRFSMMLRRPIVQSAAVLVAAFTVACAPERAILKGTVTYSQRIALTPDVVVEIELVDVSHRDVPPEVVASQTLTAPGQVPIAFEIAYDPDRIDERDTYAVQARILVAGRVEWKNTTSHPVLTHGAPDSVEIAVVPISLCDQEAATVDAIDRFVQAIEQGRDALRAVNGGWQRGDTSATFTAYYRDAELALVEEEIEAGAAGALRDWYYFCEGTLVLFRSEGSVVLDSRDNRRHDLTELFYLDRGGRLLSGRKAVDGEPVDIEDQEVQEVLDALPKLRAAISEADS